MNMCEVPLTIKVKSVIAGEYTAPPAHGPIIREICNKYCIVFFYKNSLLSCNLRYSYLATCGTPKDASYLV